MWEYRTRAANAAAWRVVTLVAGVTVVTGCSLPLGGLAFDAANANDAGSTFDGAVAQPGDDASAARDGVSRDAALVTMTGRDADPGPLDAAAEADATYADDAMSAGDAPSDGPSDAQSADGGGGEGGADSSRDGGTDSSADGGTDSSADDGDGGAEGGDDGCGPTATIASCGACGVTCDTLTGTPSCDGHGCLYVCSAGRSDCNAAQAPDTDGCECATPACCGTGCQTAHSDGVGGTFYDCLPPSTYTKDEALAACAEHAGSASYCGVGNCGSSHVVCDLASPLPGCACWGYDGNIAGHVYSAKSCYCPLSKDPRWF
jgi:hypothetical protein